MSTHYIYKITYNGEIVYIGQSKNRARSSSRYRWNQHRKNAKDYLEGKRSRRFQVIHLAMAKYGIDNFHFEKIEDNLTQDQANERENYWIEKVDPKYNINPGGKAVSGKDHPCYGMDPPNKLHLDVNYIKKLYEQGESAREIAEKLGCSKTIIYTRLKKAGVARRTTSEAQKGRIPWNKGESRISEEVIQKIILERKAGLTLKEISEKYNISQSAICIICKAKLGKDNPNYRRVARERLPIDIDYIKNLYEQGESAREIAKKFGCSDTVILKRLKRAGVVTRTLSEAHKRRSKISEDLIEKIILERKNGLTQRELSEKYNISQSAVSKILRNNSIIVVLKRKSKISEDLIQKIVLERKNGLTQRELSKKYNISQTAVSKILRKK